MTWLLWGLGILGAGAFLALVLQRFERAATFAGIGGAVAGCAIGLVPAVQVLLGAPSESLRLAWTIPYGAFSLELDALSALFLVPLFGLSAVAAIFGGEYLAPWRGRKSLGASWFFYDLLVVSMVLVVLARNAMLFLMAWETMALTSFFLVTFEDDQESVREAGWTYLVASHLGTAFLLVMFVLLGRGTGSLNFDRFTAAPGMAGTLFVLAVIGFGTKAGFMPLHVWLPEAHPAAPSHVSAVMSGVMIKMGIYGLIRTLTFLGPPPYWWGWLLVGIGLTSGILGVLYALAQHDLKRLLAYSSIENIGIIALGLGVGLLGMRAGSAPLAVAGFAGALLHVVNHALFKGLLFLGAGAVYHGTGTRAIDRLGGLSKRMPWTAGLFLVGATAICGLPPLNGFVSEFLIYLGAYGGGTDLHPAVAVPALCLIAGLALIGGLAVAGFARAFGMLFLGEPRSDHVARAHDPGPAMRYPMFVLAAGCALIGLGAPVVLRGLTAAVAQVSAPSVSAVQVQEVLADLRSILVRVAWIFGALLVLAGAVAAWRRWLLAGRTIGLTGTWDCGYAAPTARMQYTASSFAQPLTDLFASLLRTRRTVAEPAGYFPPTGSLATETPDGCKERIYRPLFRGIDRAAARLRWLQHGQVHLYVLYIALTLLVLIVWQLRSP